MSDPIQKKQPDDLTVMVEGVRTVIQNIATAARDRFPEELAGKTGQKLTRTMVAALDALYAIEELREPRPKRCRKILGKAHQKLAGLPEEELLEIRKGLKRVRRILEQII